jgi:DNA modification methylase
MTFHDQYEQFLTSKIKLAPTHGHAVQEEQLLTSLFPFQKKAVCWALQGGRRALFESFGLGKTRQQLMLALEVIKHTGKSFFIGLPLGMKSEFVEEYNAMLNEDSRTFANIIVRADTSLADDEILIAQGEVKHVYIHPIRIFYVTNDQEVQLLTSQYGPCIFLSNYERIRNGNFDPSFFGGVSFDEAAVLRSLDTLTSDYIINHFSVVPYRYVCTATPSPNEYTEILNYAHFLGVIDRGQALTRFFQRNSTKAGDLTLYPHKEKEFWLWVSSWALFVTKPSDITGNAEDDTGYNLPPLHLHWHQIESDTVADEVDSKTGNGMLIGKAKSGMSVNYKEIRKTIPQRIAKTKELQAQDPDAHWLIWHHLEDERLAIEKGIEDCKVVFGSQKSMAEREDYLQGFSNGTYKHLATKPSISGSGSNFQKYCNHALFFSISNVTHDILQAIHRILRFGQLKEAHLHFFFTSAEDTTRRKIIRCWKEYHDLNKIMTDIIKEFGLNNNLILADRQRSMGVERKEVKGAHFQCIHNDNVLELANMADNSNGLIVTSIPFGDQYEYCESYHDMGHNEGDALFFQHMDFLTPNLYRTLQPGRICAVHVKDRIQYSYQNGHGFISVNRFSDKTADHFEKHGFVMLSRITIPTDVVQENNQTYRLSYGEMCKDATKMGHGMPEYMFIFRKPPTSQENMYADIPVFKDKANYSLGRWQIKAHDVWQSNFNRLLTPEEIRQFPVEKISKWWKWYNNTHLYDFEEHVQLTEMLDEAGRLPKTFALLPANAESLHVWNDVSRMHTLNTKQANKKKEKHVCPLQFDVVDRCILQYSNPGDVVLDPYGGLMTVPYRAVTLGRYGKGVELNELYWKDGVQYCRQAEEKLRGADLFEVMREEPPVVVSSE